MFWVITGLVVVSLFAAARLFSGRQRTVLTRSSESDRTSGRIAEHTIRQNTGQFPGGMAGG